MKPRFKLKQWLIDRIATRWFWGTALAAAISTFAPAASTNKTKIKQVRAWFRAATAATSMLLLSGCNMLTFDNSSGHAGDTITINATLALDSGVTAAGLQVDLTLTPPLILGGCTTTVADTFVGNTVRQIAVTTNFWANSTTVMSCTVVIPPGTAAGNYSLTPTNVGLSDDQGKSLSIKAYGGTVHVD